MNKSGLVVKSNELIRASYSLGLVEQRLILMAIVTARETNHGITADTLLEIRAMDYAQLFNVTKQAAYMALLMPLRRYSIDGQQYKSMMSSVTAYGL